MMFRRAMFVLLPFGLGVVFVACGEKKAENRQGAVVVNCDSEEYEYDVCEKEENSKDITVDPRVTPTPAPNTTGGAPVPTATPAPTDGGTGTADDTATAGEDPTPTPEDPDTTAGGTAGEEPSPTPSEEPVDDTPPEEVAPVRTAPLQIIAVQAVDEEGATDDRQVLVDFNSKVADGDFKEESSLVFRLTREEGPRLVSDFLVAEDGTPGEKTGQECFDQTLYPWRVDIRGDGIPQDNRLKQGEEFCVVILGNDFGLGASDGIDLLRATLQDQIDNRFDGDNVFNVTCAKIDPDDEDTNTRCTFAVAVESLILSTTNEDKLIEIPPDTFTDGDGDGNGLITFFIGDTNPFDHIEPAAHPEVAYQYSAANPVDENNIFEVGDTFSIRFNVPMNIAQTKGWIDEFLNDDNNPFAGKVATEPASIAVGDFTGSTDAANNCARGCTFTISVTETVDLTDVPGNQVLLVFPPKALTSNEGAENTNNQVRFQIHDKPSAPELVQVVAELNTDANSGFPVKLENLQLDPGDRLIFRFEDDNKVPSPEVTKVELLEEIEKRTTCGDGVTLDTSSITDNGLAFTFTVPFDCFVPTNQQIRFTVDDVITDTSGNQTPINRGKLSVTLPITDGPTMPELYKVVVTRSSDRSFWENTQLNDGDTVTFFFSDSFNRDDDPSERGTPGENIVILMNNDEGQVQEAIKREMGKLSPDCPVATLDIGMVTVLDAARAENGKDGLEYQFRVPGGCQIPTNQAWTLNFTGLRDNSANNDGLGTVINPDEDTGEIPVFDRPSIPTIHSVTAAWGGDVSTSICGDEIVETGDVLRFEFRDDDGFELRNDTNQVNEAIAAAIGVYCPNFPVGQVQQEVGTPNDGIDVYFATLPNDCKISTTADKPFNIPAGLFDKSGNNDGDGTQTPILRGTLKRIDWLTMNLDFQGPDECQQALGTRCEGNNVLGDGILGPGDFLFVSFASDLPGCVTNERPVEPMDTKRTLAAVNDAASRLFGNFYHRTEVFNATKTENSIANETVEPNFYKIIMERNRSFNIAMPVTLRNVGNSTFPVTTKEGATKTNLSGSFHDSGVNEITLRYVTGSAVGEDIRARFELVGEGSILPGRWVLQSVSDDLNRINEVFEISFDDQQTGPTLQLRGR